MKSNKLTNALLGIIAFNLSVITFMQMVPIAQAQRKPEPMEVKIVGVEVNGKIEHDYQKLPIRIEGYEGMYVEYLRTGHPIAVKVLDK